MTHYDQVARSSQPRSAANQQRPFQWPIQWTIQWTIQWLPAAAGQHRCPLYSVIFVGLSLLLAGCGGETLPTAGNAPPPADQATAKSSPSESVESAAMSAEAETLRAAGVKLESDAKTGNVLSIDCSTIELNDELADKLATFGQLKKLTIRSSSMSEAGWQALAKLTQLEQLDVRDTPLNNAQLTAAVRGMKKLRALRMSGKSGSTEVDDAGLECLLQCKELKVLAADHLWISQDGLQHLSNCQQLSELYLAGTLVDDQAMEPLAKLPNLKKLRLAKTGVGTPGLETLSQLALEELDISECSQVFDDSLVAVGKITTLKRLNLWRDVISDAGVSHLSTLTNLQWLNLDNTHMGNPGLEHLRGMTKLTFLHLGSTYVTNEGMPLLTPLTALKELKVTRTSVTEEGLKALLAANPKLDVQLKYIDGE